MLGTCSANSPLAMPWTTNSDKHIGIGLAVEQALGVHQGIHRFGNQGIGQTRVAQGAHGKGRNGALQAVAGAGAVTAQRGVAHDSHFLLRGNAKHFGAKMGLGFEMLVHRTRGNACIGGHTHHRQGTKAATTDQRQSGVEQALA